MGASGSSAAKGDKGAKAQPRLSARHSLTPINITHYPLEGWLSFPDEVGVIIDPFTVLNNGFML